MKKIAYILMCTTMFACIVSCTTQTPVSSAPSYNITLTDNSQWIVGDGNTAESKATTSAEQAATPEVTATAKKSGSDMFVFFLGFALGIAAAIGAWFGLKRLKGVANVV